MIDNEFLIKYRIKPENVSQIQNEIIDSIRNNEFTEVNSKYDHNVIEHLCNDLVTQDKLGRSAKVTTSGFTFTYVLK